MKSIIVCILMIGISLNMLSQGVDFPYEKAGDMIDAKLKVKMLSENSYVLINTKDESSRYFAVNLPEEYKKDGLNVICTGIIGKVPANFRMVGTPLKLTFIKVGKGYKKLGVTVKSYKLE